MANSVDPDQMPPSPASDLGSHCLLRPVCPNIEGFYGSFFFYFCFSNNKMKGVLLKTLLMLLMLKAKYSSVCDKMVIAQVQMRNYLQIMTLQQTQYNFIIRKVHQR